ncbi:uncharacterized protein E0L32_008721 [Thyridium curvatum]|uniref:Uncharacterized protein n=1 Tax=Thyridium curvatum TaxID=1093900 RepID=A0A507AUC9_9PEZI|nr:uncharacterized protein E0L32_008721 [Thyridium curvatum]TPX10316.1 hypothetical protein E0L32_008721 [Thyridium curvatum]
MSGGYTDEAVEEGHDLFERAEAEEQRLHPNDSMTLPPGATSTKSAGLESQDNAPSQAHQDTKKSKLDSVKDALHMKK